ncbi:MAG: glycosyltransferase family 2 protein [Bacteroidota bacterium]|nr:MAG: glycosyltransferase family 2 protein [Bacteroidota bacterium]
MQKISVVIITFNEEKDIARCIASVQSIADDIVVVDSFSTDRTQEIVLEKGARFVQHAFEGHIQQKNWAITQARYPHVLSLDADEVVSKELQDEILKVKANWQADGYFFNRMTNYCGKWIKHCGWYPDRKLRLWDSRKGKWGGINPHDKFEMDEGSQVRFLKGDLYHYSYHSISQHVLQIDKFTHIGANEAIKRGKAANVFLLLIKPVWKFWRDYVFKLGFLDGYYGFVICGLSSVATFVKYLKMIELKRNAKG